MGAEATFRFDGARVAVTGGTNGIGRAIATAFVTAGARVWITGRHASAEAYSDLPSGTRFVPLDASARDPALGLRAELPVLDILVNNVGDAAAGLSFDAAVTINLGSAYAVSERLRDALAASTHAGGASIVNLASMASFSGSPWAVGYGAAKAGIVQLTRTLACAWGSEGIRVNAIAPGSVSTRMTRAYAEDPAVHAAVVRRTPLARWGTPEEIAAAALFLSSPAASFITGHTLVVDGGYSINP